MGLLYSVTLPVVTLFIFGVHQFLNAWPLINFFLPFPISPTLSVVLEHQNPVYEWAPILCTQEEQKALVRCFNIFKLTDEDICFVVTTHSEKNSVYVSAKGKKERKSFRM